VVLIDYVSTPKEVGLLMFRTAEKKPIQGNV
jgi:hypothetical protein